MSTTCHNGFSGCWGAVKNARDCLTCNSEIDMDTKDVQRKWSFANASVAAPYVGILDNPLEVNSLITIIGKTTVTCERFALNLACGTVDFKEPDIPFHFNPRVSQRYVVRNTRYKGHWGDEETTSYRSFPFERDKAFRIDIFVADQLFFVQVDGKHFCSYSERIAINKINWINVTGGVDVSNVTIGKAAEYPILEPFGESIPSIPFLENASDQPPPQIWDPMVLANLPNGLQIGYQLVVRARIHLLPHSFFINIQESARIWPRPTVMFHFNPRFSSENTKQVIVFNTRDNATWGKEERTWACRMHAGSEVEVVVCRGLDRYSCWVAPWKQNTLQVNLSLTSSSTMDFSLESRRPQPTLLGSMPVRTTNSPIGSVHIQGNLTVLQLFTCPIPPELTETCLEEDFDLTTQEDWN